LAIFDSGVDLDHPELRELVWKNTKERPNGKDDDRNGYTDDLFGWNFIDKSAKTFFRKSESDFHNDISKYYKLRAKRYTGGLNSSEQDFYDTKRKDKEFLANKKIFSSYIHGTHIAGIATNTKDMPYEFSSHSAPYNFVSIRYLGNDQKGEPTSPQFDAIQTSSTAKKWNHLNKYLYDSRKWQTNKLDKAVKYVSGFVRVINGSFGRSLGKMKDTFSKAYEDQFGNEPTQEWVDKTANKFMKDILDHMESVAKRNPHILFVFSAGNKGHDNDEIPHYPSNAVGSNIIAVTASLADKSFGKFSNFGKESVDIIAPGVAISSLTPGGYELPASGTSQAAPYVANVAIKALAIAKDRNYKLSAKTLKYIIIKTAIKKDIFKDKAKSNGLISPSNVYSTVRSLAHGDSLSKALRKNK
jgi:subtilisin family serine protease